MESQKTQLKVWVSAELKVKCDEAAGLEGVSTGEWVRRALEDMLTPEKKVEKGVELPRVAQGNRMKSITLGGGSVGGDPPVEAMGLAEAYGSVVLPRRAEESIWPAKERVVAGPKVCVECKQEITGTVAYTQQLNPICQPCARKRAGL